MLSTEGHPYILKYVRMSVASMITTILSDFARVIIKPKDKSYTGALNSMHRDLVEKLGKQYNVFDYFEINTKLLDFYKTLKPRFSVNMFTKGSLQNHPMLKSQLESVFENIFSAQSLGLNKGEVSAYLSVAEKLHTKPECIVYLDDQVKNMEAAE